MTILTSFVRKINKARGSAVVSAYPEPGAVEVMIERAVPHGPKVTLVLLLGDGKRVTTQITHEWLEYQEFAPGQIVYLHPPPTAPGVLLPLGTPLSTDPEIRPSPLSALGLDAMPTELHFVRSHFGIPRCDSRTWVLDLDGAVERPRRFTLANLQEEPSRTVTVVLECAGHRRNEFRPNTSGLQWGAGAVSEAEWTGIPLPELLAAASPAQGVCEVLLEGADRGSHRSSRVTVPFARSIPLERALQTDVLLAWEMNGRPIPPKHGGPLRVIVPGYYAVDSVKWLHRIAVRTRPFTGVFQTQDYRLFRNGDGDQGSTLHELQINALITNPEPGALIRTGLVEVAGVAWSGDGGVAGVEIRVREARWSPARLRPARQRSALAHWSAVLDLPAGEHVLQVRARGRNGDIQPGEPKWNLLGYANNSVHSFPITLGGRGL